MSGQEESYQYVDLPLPRFTPLLNSLPREGTSTRTPNCESVHHQSRAAAGAKLSNESPMLWSSVSYVLEVVLTVMFALSRLVSGDESSQRPGNEHHRSTAYMYLVKCWKYDVLDCLLMNYEQNLPSYPQNITHEAAIRLSSIHEIGIRPLLIVYLVTIERGQPVISLDFTT